MTGKKFDRVLIGGTGYAALSNREILERLIEMSRERSRGYVCIANVHTTMMGYFSRAYRRIANGAMFAVPDGMPLVWAMRSLGASNQDRVRGPSLMRSCVDEGRAFNFKHYLYGGSPAAVAKLKEVLESQYPGCEIVGALSPAFKSIEAISDAEFAEAANKINQTQAHFIWIGLGAPKQEIWMFKQKDSIDGIMVGVGAAFDLISGRIDEAPVYLQSFGLEWAYRFWKEPRRLWRRYILNNPLFLAMWFCQFVMHFFGRSYKAKNRLNV